MANVETPVTTLEDLLSEMSPQEEGDNIESVAIVGGGIMGQGIAETVARSGINVIIIEKNDKYIEESQKLLKQTMEYEISRWAMTESEMKSILKRIKWTLEFEDCKDCDIIIEPEELKKTGGFEINKAKSIFEAGYLAAKKKLSESSISV